MKKSTESFSTATVSTTLTVSDISKKIIRRIYRSDTLDLKHDVYQVCLKASVEDLRALFANLGSVAWELGNILCSGRKEKKFIANLRTWESYILFRNDINIARLHFIDTESDVTKKLSRKVRLLKQHLKYTATVSKNRNPYLAAIVFYEYPIKKST